MDSILRKLWWIPNVLTSVRVIIAPVVCVLIGLKCLEVYGLRLSYHPLVAYEYGHVSLVLTLAGIVTDWLDGLAARAGRRYGWQTDTGADFDPLADKIFGLHLFLGILTYYAFCGNIWWPLLLYVWLGTYMWWYSHITTKMRKRKQIQSANGMAKGKTAIQMLAIAFFMADIAYDMTAAQEIRTLLWWSGLTAMAISAVMCAFALKKYQKDVALAARAAV